MVSVLNCGPDRPDDSPFAVLVPDAHAIGMIGVIRSLGLAGYQVHACAQGPEALGLHSRMAHRAHVCPVYQSLGFIDWLRDIVKQQSIRVIVHSEGFLLAIRDHFDEFAHLLLVPPDRTLVYDCLSKAAVLEKLMADADTARYLPPTLLIAADSERPTSAELATLDLPIFIKADAADDGKGQQNIVRQVNDPSEAVELIDTLLQRYRRVLVQGFVPGIGTGAYVLIKEGRIIQEFMNRCLHEVPHTGGFCSLRDSWWHEEMMRDARAKIRRLGWEGVAMLEYRWDSETGRFWFVELNARFWAALHVALFAGVDFPAMLLASRRGRPVSSIDRPRLGLQVRYTIPYEVGYVASRLKDRDLTVWSRMKTVLGFFARFASPSIRSDLLYPGDRMLYFRQLWRFLRTLRS